MDTPELNCGILFDIQGFSVHDGPGCRTLIFLKGCPLQCRWCSNPEGIHPYPEPLYRSGKCVFEGHCLESCPSQSITIENGNQLLIDRSACQDCYSDSSLNNGNLPCAKACLTDALKTAGYPMSVEEVFRVISRDRDFWGPEGGITLTGGDPLYQADFSAALLRRCYEAFIHTAVETSGHAPWSRFEKILPWLDLILLDIKHMNSSLHQEYTGVPNHLILENARRLAKSFKGELIFRLPLVPGFNDDEENLSQTRKLMDETGVNSIDLLPLHHLGREKYSLLGRTYGMPVHSPPGPEYVNSIRDRFFSD